MGVGGLRENQTKLAPGMTFRAEAVHRGAIHDSFHSGGWYFGAEFSDGFLFLFFLEDYVAHRNVGQGCVKKLFRSHISG